ncbi:MAG: hypothetical protein IJR47_02995, partial [Clostridia bacterium]|nr:hypothetical protein [Clostridia bacterium]
MGKKKRAIISLMVVVLMLFSVIGTAFANEVAANAQEKSETILTEVSKDSNAVEKDSEEEEKTLQKNDGEDSETNIISNNNSLSFESQNNNKLANSAPGAAVKS